MSDQPETQVSDEKAKEKPEEATPAAEDAEVADKTPEQPPKEMRAVVLTGFGGLKSVKILKKPEPTLSEGEVLIRVKACGLNFQDLMVRQGAIDSPPKTPFILGFECAGEIEEVGEGVEDFKVGDHVVALPEYRAWSELVVVPARYVYRLPAGMSFLDAAALTMNYLVAYILLFELGGLSSGKNVLVHSAGGGVGQAVAQLCRTVSDVVVFGVASKSKHEALQSTIDHLLERGSDYGSEVRKLSPEGLDIVLDCLCGEECNRGYSLLKPMGKYILYGSSNVVTGETKSFFSVAKSWWQVDKVSPIKLFDENKTLSGFNLRHLLYQQNGAPYVKGIMESVFALWKEGKIKPVVDSTWALEDVPEAMQKMHDRKNIGKIVLDPSLEPKPKPATPAKGKAKGGDKDEKKKEDEKKDDEKKEDDASGNDTATAEQAAETKDKEATS
ncbi:synaptic vesicle membrane protein VAT-1 homolog-like isoform X2 [Bacillus rossius redtenbacheri]|uniref:synaptic vesicle membrane protein VAT-1 homolog-like isoform X2 n=1 Tax=Bacillus rossius redtenbacheri TaxID=93214 RepID=UPI002FDCE9DD